MIKALERVKIYDVNTGKPIVAVVINAPAKIKKGRQGKFFKFTFVIRNNYIGIYTVCLPLDLAKDENLA